MKLLSAKKAGLILSLALCFLVSGALTAQAKLRTRIVVLPFYVEEGNQAATGQSSLGFHYRRMSGFIENQLVSHDFEVIDPFAKDASERELGRVMERAREDSMLVSQNMCQRFGTDAAYIVWMKVKVRRTGDGYYKAVATVDGKGYDSGGRSLGANVVKTLKATKRNYDEAITLVEKEVGDVVGRTLIRWNRSAYGTAGSGSGKGVLARNVDRQAKYINLRLDQANEYEIVEVFGKVVNTVRGVEEAKRYSQKIVAENPQACVTEWEVEINTSRTDPFRLQANIMKMVNDILDAGGRIVINGVPYRYTPSEMKLLMGLVPGNATSRSVQFVIDRERMRDREFSGRHDPEKSNSAVKNFE